MKMKRALKCIGALALAVSLTMVPSMIPVQASNGPCIEGDFAFANIQLNDTVVFSANERNTVDGVSYDQASNTLTLTNYDHPDVALYTNMMGDDFKLNLVGSNKLQNLRIWHGGWGGSLTICGSGSLTVNENRKNSDGIELFAEGGKSLLTVSEDSTVTLYRGADGCPFGSSWNYTSSPIVAKGQVSDMKIQAEHPFELDQVYGGYFGNGIGTDRSDVYTKAGEEGRFVMTEITDMSGNKTYRIEKLQECAALGAEVAITVEDNLTDISAYTANGEVATYYSTTMTSGGSDAHLVKKLDTGETFIYSRNTYYEAGNTYRILCPILMSYTDYNTQQTRYLMDVAHPLMKEVFNNMSSDTLLDGYEFEGTEVENAYNVHSEADVISFTPKQVVVDGVVDITDGNTTISNNGFQQILTENQTKDIVIKSNDELSFTFGKGTMSAVDNVSNYDFGVKIEKDFSALSTLPSEVNKNIFIEQIKYNYSGQLPAEAQIRIFVGTQYAGKTLYYSRLYDNGTILNIDAGVVDAEGYLTVKQSHCSTYLITTEKLADTATIENGGTNSGSTTGTANTSTAQTTANSQPTVKTSGKPKTGDTSAIAIYMTLLAAGCGGMFVFRRKKATE
ncbi:MAG: sortase B protein-sorting domain-containing protein, partial [Lachnospiraceae bacterium]|nr:sortase B protein-sorting domain-containing protein [Lachnospiraceae bacterium]